jgi:hypothetical protein
MIAKLGRPVGWANVREEFRTPAPSPAAHFENFLRYPARRTQK